MRIHHPRINLEDISRGSPPGLEVECMLLGPFYMAADGPAKNIVAFLERETAATLRRQRAELYNLRE